MLRVIKLFALLPLFFSLYSVVHANGFGLNATRLIYPSDARSISLAVRNTETSIPYLVQTSISTQQNSLSQAPFIVTPPLFRMEPESENQVRITFNGTSLPRDRESVFYIHARAVPASTRTNASQTIESVQGGLSFGIANVIKLFFRPAGLRSTPEDAQKGLQFTYVLSELKVRNPSPYFVSLARLEVDGRKMALDSPEALMLSPGGGNTWRISNGAHHVKWQTINDYGGTSEFRSNIP